MTLFKSRINVLERMKKQGFSTQESQNCSIGEMQTLFDEKQMDMMFTLPEKRCYVKYFVTENLKPVKIEEIVEDLYHGESVLLNGIKDSILIIVKDEVNDTIQTFLRQLYEREGIFVIVESLPYLQFNILDHCLVHPHFVLTDEEKQTIMVTHNVISDDQFPEINRFDPISRAIGLRPGQLCRILRSSPTSIQSDYFRVCI